MFRFEQCYVSIILVRTHPVFADRPNIAEHTAAAVPSCPPTHTNPPHHESPRTDLQPKALLHDTNHGFLRSCSRTQGRPGGRGVTRRRRCRNGKSSEPLQTIFSRKSYPPYNSQRRSFGSVCLSCVAVLSHIHLTRRREKLTATKSFPAGAGRWVSLVGKSTTSIVAVRRCRSSAPQKRIRCHVIHGHFSWVSIIDTQNRASTTRRPRRWNDGTNDDHDMCYPPLLPPPPPPSTLFPLPLPGAFKKLGLTLLEPESRFGDKPFKF